MRQKLLILCFFVVASVVQAADSVHLIPRLSYVNDEPMAEVIIKTKSTVLLKEVPTAGFKIGANEVVIDGKKVIINKLEKAANQVRIDNYTGIIYTADGLPFIPCGFYCYSPVQKQLLEQEAVRGQNMYSPYQRVEGKTLKERLWYMDRAAAVGMKVNYNLLSVAGGGGVGSAQHKKSQTVQEKWKLLGDEIRAIKDHPALLSWYIADEPEGQGVKPETLEEIYGYIKSIDPYHPITVVIMSAGPGRTFANSCDIIMCDTYPVPNSPAAGVVGAVQGLYDELKYEKAIWYVPQTFGGGEWWPREPTPAEIRMMTWGTTLVGARGYQAFVRHGLNAFPKNQEMWGAYTKACREIQILTPKLLTPGTEMTLRGDKALLGRQFGDTYVVVNKSNTPQKYSALIDSCEAYYIFDDYSVEAFGGVLEGSLEPFGVQIFSTTNPNLLNKGSNASNMVHDPSFEWGYSLSSQQPAAIYAGLGTDQGATYFLDSRTAYHGERSLRLVSPIENGGIRMGFFPLPHIVGKSYIMTVWAKTDSQTLRQNPKGVKIRLNLGGFASKDFTLTDKWQQYTLNAPYEKSVPDPRALGSSVELLSKGVAWFDMVEIIPDMDFTVTPSVGGFSVAMNCHIDGGTIHYTLDGAEPTESSTTYTTPLLIDNVVTVKARVFKDGKGYGLSQQQVAAHKAMGAKVSYVKPYTQYSGGGDKALTDGRVAELRFQSPEWQGFIDNDMEVVIDLGVAKDINKITSQYLHSASDWIAPAVAVEYLLSDDGVTFKSLGTIELGQAEEGTAHKIPVTKGDIGQSARYIKVIAKGHHTMPSWHAGGSAWLFCDEIIVE